MMNGRMDARTYARTSEHGTSTRHARVARYNYFSETIKGVVLRYPGGPKFAQNRSICYDFRDKQHFRFLPKFKMAAKIWKFSIFRRT